MVAIQQSILTLRLPGLNSIHATHDHSRKNLASQGADSNLASLWSLNACMIAPASKRMVSSATHPVTIAFAGVPVQCPLLSGSYHSTVRSARPGKGPATPFAVTSEGSVRTGTPSKRKDCSQRKFAYCPYRLDVTAPSGFLTNRQKL